jgi:hypothetical protein
MRDRIAALALAGAVVLIVSDSNSRTDELVRQLTSQDPDARAMRECDALGRGLGQLMRTRIVDEEPQLAFSTDWLDVDNFVFKADRTRLNELAIDSMRVLMKCSTHVRAHTPPAHHKCSRLRGHDCAN